MKKALIVWLFSGSLAQAITWDFDTNGNSQGWYARESHTSGAGMDLLPLSVEVSDGILRVYLRPYVEHTIPTVLLVSPEIDHDSGLFDRVGVRVRLVHTRPLEGRLLLSWTNAHNRQTPGMDPGLMVHVKDQPIVDRFLFIPSPDWVTYTTEWQTLSLRGFAEAPELVWQDTLIDLRLNFVLSRLASVSGPGDVPEALEIDWIVLTGVEEQLRGELPLPPSPPRPLPGTLFAPVVFHALEQKGIDKVLLGDGDGDGDLDAVVRYMDSTHVGNLTTALNDGTGRFTPGSWTLSGKDLDRVPSWGFVVKSADFNRDGYADLAMGMGVFSAQVWLNTRDGSYERTDLWETRWLRALADVDGDGDQDLCLLETAQEDEPLVWVLNDGRGHFTEEVILNPGETQRLFLEIADFLHNGRQQVIQTPPFVGSDPKTGQAIYGLDKGYPLLRATLDFPLEPLQWLNFSQPIRAIAFFDDVDHDGDVDIALSNDAMDSGNYVVMINQGEGEFEPVFWLPEGMILADVPPNAEAIRSVPSWDFNGDGIVDLTLIDHNATRGQNILVMLGRNESLPVVEGQYSIPGNAGKMDAGDVDHDGDLDIVVPTGYEDGGLYVLRNLTMERRSTNVAEIRKSRLLDFVLGTGYPNPFNAATVLPLTLPEDRAVRIEIHNVVGQRVRRLVDGVLEAGTHRVAWDGRDEWGEEVVSGVYLCRVQAGDQVQVRKLVKVE